MSLKRATVQMRHEQAAAGFDWLTSGELPGLQLDAEKPQGGRVYVYGKGDSLRAVICDSEGGDPRLLIGEDEVVAALDRAEAGDPLDIETVREIFRKIAARETPKGGFLTAFAEALVKADSSNLVLLLPAASALVRKFNLGEGDNGR